ncbi:metal-sulfur cluster assembly factor [Pseudonocardia xishanensis]|uniref:metal-sulfur cluster assembly factor n=1 Tax=Pseudonocardia xishanensis TaxID=630995 RepID=UPI0031E9F06C
MTAAAVVPDAETVMAALEVVNDPHVPSSLRRMGMVAGVEVAPDGGVRVRIRIPCMACPGTAMIRDGVHDAVAALPGVTAVKVVEAWEEPWTRDMVDPATRRLMHDNGIQI